MPPTGRHPGGYGHTGHGSAAPGTAWPQPIASSEVLARSRRGPALTGSRRRHHDATTGQGPAGVVGPGTPGHALALTPIQGVIKARALPYQRVMLHAGHRYYAPLGLPLPSASLHHRLIPAVFARRRPGRRASPVPAQTVRA